MSGWLTAATMTPHWVGLLAAAGAVLIIRAAVHRVGTWRWHRRRDRIRAANPEAVAEARAEAARLAGRGTAPPLALPPPSRDRWRQIPRFPEDR